MSAVAEILAIIAAVVGIAMSLLQIVHRFSREEIGRLIPRKE